jgi:hypothetical protein
MKYLVNVYVFGPLKYQFNPEAKLSEETVIKLPFVFNETLEQLLKRLKLSNTDYGECFINHTIVNNTSDLIPKNARVAIFSHGMLLIDGGLYLKKWKH